MPSLCSIPNKVLFFYSVAPLFIVLPNIALAGSATGLATEWTQLANNAELVDLLESSGAQVDNQLTQISQLTQQIENQLKIYANMLQNIARLPSHVWGDVEQDLNQLRQVVDEGQSIAFSMSNADELLQQRFQSYQTFQADLPGSDSFSSAYQNWSETARDTVASTLRAASLTAEQFDSEGSTMRSLREMSESADGQMKALQVGHEIAAQQIAQMQKLRGLVSQHMTLMGTWLQAQQTDRDLAQARREAFFETTMPPISGGAKMKVEW